MINPRASLELAARRIPVDLKRFPFDGRFLDCVGSCPFWEGEDWDPRHPLDARGTRRAREELLLYAYRRGLLVGTEAGIDSYLPYLHWLETPMSLVRSTVGSMPLPGWDPVPLQPDYQINVATTTNVRPGEKPPPAGPLDRPLTSGHGRNKKMIRIFLTLTNSLF